MDKKKISRLYRHRRVRKKIKGTGVVPRLSVYRSLSCLHAQLIDDSKSHTLLYASTQQKELRKTLKYGGNIKAANILGEHFAKKSLSLGIKRIVFDRGCYKYHGRVKAFAEAARKAGLEF